jgi:hypothetical protein
MSEFNSFYLQTHISKENLDMLLAQKSKNIEDYTDWEPWFSSKQRFADIKDQAKFIATYGYRFTKTLNEEMRNLVEHVKYDEATQLLILDNINIGENYELFMQYYVVLRAFGGYVVPGSKNNFMINFDYWWAGSNVSEYIEFNEQGRLLTDEVDPQNYQIAVAYFDEHGEQFAKEFYKKNGRF